MDIKKLNQSKLLLEAKASRYIFQVLKNQTNDVIDFFISDKLNSQNISENYLPEILKAVRDAMRLSIATFGYSMRSEIEKDFKIQFKIEIDNSSFDEVNKQLSLAFSVFIANESEKQAKLITQTSAKEIDNVVRIQTDIKMNEIDRLIKEQDDLRLLNTEQDKKRIAVIDAIIRNAKRDTAKNIKVNLLANAKSRARLIGEQIVGVAEAYARNKESEVISNQNIATSKGKLYLTKTWVAILDKRTRDNHISADGQEVSVNDAFNVGGEKLQYPRDPDGSASNIIRCRCLAIYNKKYF